MFSSPSPSHRLLEHPANHRGRDFIVGDLHGMRAALDRALARVRFDTGCDRLFSTGDLVDRGPASLDCLALIEEPWFHAVLGNHERMLLAHLGHPETWLSRFHARRYTQDWVAQLGGKERSHLDALLPRLACLPWARKIVQGTHQEHWYVMHADRWGGRRLLSDEDLDTQLCSTGSLHVLRQRLTWSRRVARQALSRIKAGLPLSEWEEGVSLTYVGHTVVPRVVQHRSHVFVDCGAAIAALRRSSTPFVLPLLEHRATGWLVHT